MEFWPTDPVTFPFVRMAYEMIRSRMPSAAGKLFYDAPGETQRALYQAEKDLYDASSIAVIRTEDLFANVSYTALTPGQANGVAITKNIYDAAWRGYYVNVQVGEDLVTNPEAYSIPDEFLVADLDGEERYEIQYIRHSNLVPTGGAILTKDQIFELADVMALIQRRFRTLYRIRPTNLDFAMDIEFKVTGDGRLNVKQARPWVE